MKMRNNWLLMMLFLALALLLAACGGGVSEDEAADAVRAIFEGESADAAEFFCEAQQPALQNMSSLPDGISLEDVDCEHEGNTMRCEVNFSVEAGAQAGNFAPPDADADAPATTEVESGDAESGDVGMSESGTNTGESGADPVSAQDDQIGDDEDAAAAEASSQQLVIRFALEDNHLCDYRFD